MPQLRNWRFYGRRTELERLAEVLRWPTFEANSIDGRRGIGKTELIKEATRLCEGQPPVLVFELKTIDREAEQSRNERFVEEARGPLPRGLLEGFPAPDHRAFDLPSERFRDLLADLINRGLTVVLDEFHLADDQRITDSIKIMIDEFTSTRAKLVPGSLLVVGSHQQQLHRMFLADEALHQRVEPAFTLRQWAVPTVLEMAREQGFLDHPRRFLTLWTAFGGIPRYWHQFVHRSENRQLRDMMAWDSDDQWRRAFVKVQEARLQPTSGDRTDNKVYIELAAAQREILQWLAQEHPNGTEWNRLVRAMKGRRHGDIMEPIRLLASHLELVEYYGEFWRRGDLRVRVVDNATLFQRNVLKDLFAAKPGDLNHTESSARRIARRVQSLETIEGAALERLAVGFLKAQPGITWSGCGSWRAIHGRKPGNVEVDVMALRGDDDNPEDGVIMCGCKREAGNHDLAKLDAEFHAFRNSVLASGSADRWPCAPVAKLLVSPAFGREQRDRARGHGFTTLDIRDMAGLEPLDAEAKATWRFSEPRPPDDSFEAITTR